MFVLGNVPIDFLVNLLTILSEVTKINDNAGAFRGLRLFRGLICVS